jgi:hypothetical protein
MLLADYQAYVECQQSVSRARSERMDPHVHSELRAGRLLLIRPLDPGVLPRHLER